MEDAEEYQVIAQAEEIIPVEQGIITFYGKPILVVRLPDGRPAVVIRSLCENMGLDRLAQVRRIQRTAPIAHDLVSNVRIETEGGSQPVQALILRAVPYWLTGIDHKRVRPELRDDVLRYQCEAVDVLYSWAQQPRALPAPAIQAIPADLEARSSTAMTVPAPGSAILVPMDDPGPEATHRQRAHYHELMSVWHRHQADVHAEQWRVEVESRVDEQEARLEAKEAVVDLVPEILERLGPITISKPQQQRVKALVQKLHEATGKHQASIYSEFYEAFRVPRYQELLSEDFNQAVQWFEIQIQRASNKKG